MNRELRNLIEAKRAYFIARTAINMNLTLAWIMAEAGVMRPEAVDALEKGIARGFAGTDVDPTRSFGEAEVLRIMAEIEAITVPALARIRAQAVESWKASPPGDSS